MSLTPSNMLALGTKAPYFKLIDAVTNTKLSLNELKGSHGTVVSFICNHCPFVIHINKELSKIAKDYKEKGIKFIAISSNDIENYPQDAPHLMKEVAKKEAYIFPYLYDETQAVAKAYDAACTPDFYAFDKDLKLVYRGQLDDSRPGNGVPLSGTDLRNALHNILTETEINPIQKPSIGCNIKWRKS